MQILCTHFGNKILVYTFKRKSLKNFLKQKVDKIHFLKKEQFLNNKILRLFKFDPAQKSPNPKENKLGYNSYGYWIQCRLYDNLKIGGFFE